MKGLGRGADIDYEGRPRPIVTQAIWTREVSASKVNNREYLQQRRYDALPYNSPLGSTVIGAAWVGILRFPLFKLQTQ